MVKALFVGLLAATICGIVFTAPAAVPNQLLDATYPPPDPESSLEEDPAARSERSTNLSHVSGTARKIQMFIKNRHLQVLPDGTVNGTTDDTSAYTILQRTAVAKGQMRIQGVATCQYLCMDSCGLLYGSLEFGDECVFNETMEKHNYNTYSSSKYSNERKTLYLALNRRGQPRKVVLRASHQLGRLSSYTRVLFRNVGPERAEELHPMRHHGHNCLTTTTHQNHHQSSGKSPDPPRCRKRKKRKKKKRKCPEDEFDPEVCQKRQSVSNNNAHHRAHQNSTVTTVLKCDDKDDKDNDECQRDVTKQKKHKNNSDKPLVSVLKKKKKNRKGVRKRLEMENVSTETTTTTVTSTVTPPPDDVTPDEDYGVDSSTHIDWEDSTALPDVSMAVSDATRLTAQPHFDSD